MNVAHGARRHALIQVCVPPISGGTYSHDPPRVLAMTTARPARPGGVATYARGVYRVVMRPHTTRRRPHLNAPLRGTALLLLFGAAATGSTRIVRPLER